MLSVAARVLGSSWKQRLDESQQGLLHCGIKWATFSVPGHVMFSSSARTDMNFPLFVRCLAPVIASPGTLDDKPSKMPTSYSYHLATSC